MPGTIEDITIGPGQIFVAPYGTPIPTLSGNATDFAAFKQPGFTDDGIEWDYTPTWKDIMVDELLGPAKKVLTGHKLIANTKFAETSLQNLGFAIGASTYDGISKLTIGSILFPPEFILGFMGPGPNGGTRSGVVYRCVSIAPLKGHYQRKDKVVYAVQFEGLSDPTQPQASDLATYQDFATPFVLS
jgi:hypothetical protein